MHFFHKQLRQLYKPRRFTVDSSNNNVDTSGNPTEGDARDAHFKPFDLDTEEVWGEGGSRAFFGL